MGQNLPKTSEKKTVPTCHYTTKERNAMVGNPSEAQTEHPIVTWWVVVGGTRLEITGKERLVHILKITMFYTHG